MDHLTNQLYEWVITAAATNARMDSGSANARGSTTSELRVLELKADSLRWPRCALVLRSSDSPHDPKCGLQIRSG